MSLDILLHVFVGLAPVLCFLGALLYLDSYKLVSMRAVVTVVFCGLIAALASYLANGWLLGVTAMDLDTFKRVDNCRSDGSLTGVSRPTSLIRLIM